jgi:hypothetical protein
MWSGTGNSVGLFKQGKKPLRSVKCGTFYGLKNYYCTEWR